MKEEYKDLPLVKNEEKHQFEMKVGDLMAIIIYEEKDGKIILIHTEVEPDLEGKGAATAIIEKTLDYIEKNNFWLIPLCPVVVSYLKRHPEWMRLLPDDLKPQ